MNAGRVGGRLVEELDGTRKGKVGICDPQGCGGDFSKVGFDEDGGGLRSTDEGGVLGVGDEGQVTGASSLDGGDSGDSDGGIALEGGSKVLGEVCDLHGAMIVGRGRKGLEAAQGGSGIPFSLVSRWVADCGTGLPGGRSWPLQERVSFATA